MKNLLVTSHGYRAVIGMSIVALGLSACGVTSSGSGSGKPAAVAVVVPTMPRTHYSTSPASEIRFSDWQFPDTLNPVQTTAAVSFETINATSASLLVYDQHAKLVPYMLTAVPSTGNGLIRDRGKLIILKLRPGQRWSNGREITNADIKFGWQIYVDPVTGPLCLGTCDHIARIDLKGKYEADLHMRDTYSAVLANGLPTLYPHSWTALGSNPHAAAVTLASNTTFNYEGPQYVTSGPYKVAQYMQNDRISLVPNPYYHGPGAAFARRLLFVFYSSKQGMIAAAQSGQTDMTTNYTLADLKQFNGAGSVAVHNVPGFTIERLEFNSLDPTFLGQPNPLHRFKVRQALALAIDKVGMVQSAFGVSRRQAQQVVASSPLIVTPTFVQPFGDTALTGQWDPIAHKYLSFGPQAKADARTLLAQAGYPHGLSLHLLTTAGNPVRQAQAGVITKNWSDIGVQVLPDYTSSTHMFASWNQGGPLNHGNFQVAMFAFLGGADPDGLKTNLVSTYIDRRASNHTAVNGNYAGIMDPVIDQAFRQGAGSFKDAVRRAAYTRMQIQMNKMAYWVPLYSRPSIDTTDGSFSGFAANPTLLGPTWNAFAWKPLQT